MQELRHGHLFSGALDVGRGVINQGLGHLDVMSGQNRMATGNYQVNHGINQMNAGHNMNMNPGYYGYEPRRL